VVPATGAGGQTGSIRFRVLGPDGVPVTAFAPQEELMHIYLVRRDFAGFQHLHATLDGDLTWTAPLAAAMAPGVYRMYASFTAIDANSMDRPLVLGDQLTIAGTDRLPRVGPVTAEVHGYTLAVAGKFSAGVPGVLIATVTNNGKPIAAPGSVTDTYADVAAFRDNDMEMAQLGRAAPAAGDGRLALSIPATFAKPGSWRVFVRFQPAADGWHTAVATLAVP
jgi:hypothetical protein